VSEEVGGTKREEGTVFKNFSRFFLEVLLWERVCVILFC
jgi:hypothetical protein